MVEIDSETLFDVAAAVVATLAVLFFVFNVELAYSPVTEVALVAAFLAGVLTITQRSSDYRLVVLGYGLIVTAVIGLFFDLIGTFDAGDEATVVGLLVLATLLFGLRTRLDDDGHFVTGRTATYAFAVLAVLAVAVLLVDVATGGVAYELQHDATVEYVDTEDSRLVIGAITATNPTPLPVRVQTPRYTACAAGNWSEYAPPSPPGEPERQVHLSLYVDDGYNEHVFAFGSKSYPVTLRIEGANLTGTSFPIERTSDCPGTDTGDPYVALFEAPDDQRYRYAL
jgi:hypothetical protein